jgi:putative membrane protein insertion efficiency factor
MSAKTSDHPSVSRRLLGWPRKGLIGLVRAYRLLLSPWLGSSCRFDPTCSAYALVALERHGARRGGSLTLMRIARCHPWCAGGHDPVPDQSHRLFSSLLAPPDAHGDKAPDTSGQAPVRPIRKTSV